jgi:hypothetical protein
MVLNFDVTEIVEREHFFVFLVLGGVDFIFSFLQIREDESGTIV